MEKTLIVNKPLGYTPLQIVSMLKTKYPEYQNIRIGYAGRLDPQAEGLLLLLLGDENKNKDSYENLDKEYEFEMLLGVSTDTYDIMGIPSEIHDIPADIKDNVEKIIETYRGTRTQEYPPYSSAHVQGKPLYYWARKKLLNTIKIPQREITIHDIHIVSYSELSSKELLKNIKERLDNVTGDFRQEEIYAAWNVILKNDHTFPIVQLKVKCTSGTYVRSIAHEIGSQLQCGAIALTIKRTRVGMFSLTDAIKLL